jgi:hypothetical protein
MKTQKILDNFRALPVEGNDKYLINDILLAMFQEELHTGHDEDLLSLVPGNVFEVRRVYRLYTGQDHFCKLLMLCVNDKPVIFYGRHGHEDSADGQTSVIDAEAAFSLATQLSAALSVRRLQKYRETMSPAPQELLKMGGEGYIAALSDSTFGIHEDDSLDQPDLMKAPFSAWVYTGETLARIQSMTRQDTDDGRKVFGKIEQGEVQLEHGKVVFQFLDGEADREAAKAEMSTPGDWVLSTEECNEQFRMAAVYVREANTWPHHLHLITFGTRALYKAFVSKYSPDGTAQQVQGEFPWDTVPDDACIE